jgi:hypothetical protein
VAGWVGSEALEPEEPSTRKRESVGAAGSTEPKRTGLPIRDAVTAEHVEGQNDRENKHE